MGEMRQGISGICFHLHFSLRNFTLPSPICLSPTIRSTTSLSPLLLLPLSPWVSPLFHPRKMEELSVELPTQTIPHCEPSKHSDLQFDRLQPSDEDLDQDKKLEFGQFVAREATLDEEYWASKLLQIFGLQCFRARGVVMIDFSSLRSLGQGGASCLVSKGIQ